MDLLLQGLRDGIWQFIGVTVSYAAAFVPLIIAVYRKSKKKSRSRNTLLCSLVGLLLFVLITGLVLLIQKPNTILPRWIIVSRGSTAVPSRTPAPRPTVVSRHSTITASRSNTPSQPPAVPPRSTSIVRPPSTGAPPPTPVPRQPIPAPTPPPPTISGVQAVNTRAQDICTYVSQRNFEPLSQYVQDWRAFHDLRTARSCFVATSTTTMTSQTTATSDMLLQRWRFQEDATASWTWDATSGWKISGWSVNRFRDSQQGAER